MYACSYLRDFHAYTLRRVSLYNISLAQTGLFIFSSFSFKGNLELLSVIPHSINLSFRRPYFKTTFFYFLFFSSWILLFVVVLFSHLLHAAFRDSRSCRSRANASFLRIAGIFPLCVFFIFFLCRLRPGSCYSFLYFVHVPFVQGPLSYC